jgi:hypothetical protein
VKKTKVIIVCLGTLSSGEASIISSCFGVADDQLELFAVVSDLCASYFGHICKKQLRLDVCAGRLENLIAFNHFVSEVKPDFFVCADLSTMNYSSSWSGIDVDVLKNYRIKIIGVDQYSCGNKNPEWDWLDTKVSSVEKNNPKICDFLIRPVPLNKQREDFDNILHCPLFPEKSVEVYKENSGIGNCSEREIKRVFIANSHWEYNENSPRLAQSVIALREWIPEIIYRYLEALDFQVEVVHVGPKKWKRNNFSEKVIYKHYVSLPTEVYQNYLKESDALITTNVTSITMSSALRYGTPCILMCNPKPINFKRLEPVMSKLPFWYSEMAKDVKSVGAFRMFPWGWNQFLKNIVDDNPYMDLIFQAPIFEPKKATNLIRQVLTDGALVESVKEKNMQYFEMVSRTESLTRKLLTLR